MPCRLIHPIVEQDYWNKEGNEVGVGVIMPGAGAEHQHDVACT